MTTSAHRPPATDHVHNAVPLETAFDFLNTLELDDDAAAATAGQLVERLTSLEVAAKWLADAGVVRSPRTITGLARHARGGRAGGGRRPRPPPPGGGGGRRGGEVRRAVVGGDGKGSGRRVPDRRNRPLP